MNISIGNLGGSNPSVNELISQLVSKRTQSLNSLLEQKSSIENTLAALQSGGLGIGSLNNSYSSQIASLQDTIDRLNEQYTLNANKITTINSLKKSYNSTVTSLDKYLESLKNPNNAGKDLDIYLDGNKVSSNDKVNVTVNDKDTNIQEITLNVTQLATTSKLFSNVLIGGNVTENTLITDLFAGLYDETKNSITTNRQDIKESLKLSELGITSGSFNIGSSKITIDADTDTIGSVIQKIKDAGYNAQIVTKEFDSNGEAVGSFMISGADGKSIAITSQTTNFASQMGLTVSEGNFYINGAEFNITDTTTLGSLINDINAASADNVGAKLENGKLVFVASETGEVDINVEKGTSNFTNAIGFTVGGVMNTTNLVMGTDGSFVTLTGTKDGISSTDSVANGKFTAGNFNVYYNEVDEHGNVSDTLTKVIIEVTEDDTIESIIQKIEDQTKGSYVDEEGKTIQTGLTAAVVDGHFQIRQLQKGAEFSISVEAGSSNFTNYVGMTSAINAQTSKDAENSYVLGSVKVPASGFSEGSFTISTNKVSDDGKTALFEMATATITVEAGDTAESIAQKITDAGIGLTASITEDGFFKIEQNNSGVDFDIKIEAGGTDFTYKAGLTTDIISTGVLSPGSTDLQYTSLTGSSEVDENTSVSGGTFKINGITININAGTISSAIDDINAYRDQTGVNAFLKDGHLVLQANETGPDHTLYIEGGTSNIGTVAGFLTKTETAAAATIGQNGSKSTLTGAYNVTEDSMITAGSIVINGYTINLNAGSLKDAITEINKHSSDTKVTASISNGKFVLTSTENGAVNITASAGTSNIAQVTGIAAYQSQAGKQEIIGASKTTLTAAATGLKETDAIGESVISINGQKMTLSGTLKSAINTINANSGFTGVEAYIDSQGRFVLQNVNTGSKGINFVSISGDFTRVIGAASSTTTAGSSSQVDRTPASMHGGTTGLELNTEIIGGGTLTINGHDISLDGISSINGVINAINSAKIGVTASLDDDGRFIISALDPMQTLNVSYSGKGNFGYVAGIGSYTIGSAAGSTGTPGTGGVQGGNNGFVTGSTEFNQSAGIIGSNNGIIIGSTTGTTFEPISEQEALAQGYTIIKTADDLKNISGDVSKKYMLMNDIDMSDVDWTTIAEFKGTLDGNGYTIKNLKDTLIQSAGTVKNIEFENINITDNGIFGTVRILDNVHATGYVQSVSGSIGGLATGASSIVNSSFEGTVEGNFGEHASVGGLVGFIDASYGNVINDGYNYGIFNSYSKGTVVNTDGHAGGLVGDISSGSIENSYSEAYVEGDYHVGGLAGSTGNYIKFLNSYSTGDINGRDGMAGGIVGWNHGSIQNCYATGNIKGSTAGGLAGLASGLIENSYATGNIYGSFAGGGLIGQSGAGANTTELKNVFFAGAVTSASKFQQQGKLIGNAYNADTNEVIITNSYVVQTAGSSLPIVGGDDAAFVDTSDVTEVVGLSQIKSDFSQVWDNAIWDFSESEKSGTYPLAPVQKLSEAEAIAQGYTIIKTAQDLQNINNNLSGKYILMGDIDLSGINWTPLGSLTDAFTGELNGNGFSIKNLTIDGQTKDNVGLFANLNGTISNLRMKNVDIRGNNYVGAIAGVAGTSTIKNVVIEGTIKGEDYVSGLIGEGTNSIEFDNVHYIGDVSGGNYVSGIVSAQQGSNSIKNSSFTGNVTGSGDYVAGIAAAYILDIEKVSVNGSVVGNDHVGGVASYLFYNSTFNQVHVNAAISGNNYVGGVVGTGSDLSESANVYTNIYVEGSVQGNDYVGGVVGYNPMSIRRNGLKNVAINSIIDSNSYKGILYGYGRLQIAPPPAGSNENNHVIIGNFTAQDIYFNSDKNSPYLQLNGYISDDQLGFTSTGLTSSEIANPSSYTGFDSSSWDFSESTPKLKNNVTNDYRKVSAGAISINGQSVSIEAGDISNAIDAINAVSSTTGVTASINENGNVVLQNADGSDKQIVINSCTSDFLDVAGIEKAGAASGGSGSSYNNGEITAKNKLKSDTKLLAGVININGTDINIAANSTVSSVVSAINAKSSTTGVSASIDENGYIQLKNVDGSTNNIDIKNTSGSVLNALGLIDNTSSIVKANTDQTLSEKEAIQQGYTIIKTVDDLLNISINNGKYVLMNDIDLAGINWDSLSDREYNSFTLDGNGFSIKNLTVDTDEDYAGFIGISGGYVEVKNITFENAKIKGGKYAGVVGGSLSETDIDNVNVISSHVESDYRAGGIAAHANAVSNSTFTGSVTSVNMAGGIVATTSIEEYYENLYVNADITATDGEAGGIVGSVGGTGNNIINAQASGTVTGEIAGGIAGSIGDFNIDGVYADNTVTGEIAGGIVGRFDDEASVENAYFAGQVSGSKYQGGIVGSVCEYGDMPSEVNNSFWKDSTKNLYGNIEPNVNVPSPEEDPDFIQLITSNSEANGFEYIRGELSYDRNFWTVSTGSADLKVQDGQEVPSLPVDVVATTHRISEKEALEQGYTIIKTAQDLQNIKSDGKYILMNDIDLSSIDDWTPLEKFSGHLNGNGFVIKNLTITAPTQSNVGLFSELDGAFVENIGLENVYIDGYYNVGGIAGYSSKSIIANSYVTGDIQGSNYSIGAIIGNANYNTIISNVYSSGTVKGESDVGGLVGNLSGELNNSYTDASVIGVGDSNYDIAGLVGQLYGTISNSFSNGNVSGKEGEIGVAGYANVDYAIINTYYNSDNFDESMYVDEGTDFMSDVSGLTSAQMSDEDTYRNAGFSTNIWDFNNGKPELAIFNQPVPQSSASSGGSSSQSISAGTVTLNGQTIDIAGGSIEDVISQINSQSGKTGVVASLNSNNQLVFKNDDGSTDHIVIKEGTSDLLDVAGIQEQAELTGMYTTLTGGRDVTNAVFNEGQITINKNGQNIVVDIDANSTAQDVVDAINAADSGIIASLVNKDGKQYMQIRSTTAGADNIYISVSKGNFGALTGLASSFAAGPTFSDQPGYKTTIKSNYYIYQADSTKTFTGGSITIDGTKINAAGKTLQQVVDEINAAGLGVTATLTSAVDNNGDSYQTFSLSKTASTADASKFTVSTDGDFARVVGLGAYSTGAGVQGVTTPSVSTPQGGSQLTGSFDVTHVNKTEEEFEAMGYTVIKTANDLINIKNNLSGNYVLMDDIDLSSYNFTGAVITGTFTGQFIGNGYTISNMTINSSTSNTNIGLFEQADGATIAAVNLKNVAINCGTNICSAGALIGRANRTSIGNINIDFGENGGINNALYGGGIVGNMSGSTVTVSSVNGGTITTSDAALTQNTHIGGIAGFISDSNILKSYSTADIASVYNTTNAGGIAGYMTLHSLIEQSFYNGTIDGIGGGIAGHVYEGTIKNSFYNSNKASQDFESFDSSSSTVTMPSGQSAGLVDSDFANSEIFTNAGYSTSYWDFSGDMPALLSSTSASISAGSVVINGTTINLSSGSISNAISKINSYSDETGVTASINENGNVVLESDGALEVKSGTSDFFAVAGIITENTRITEEQAADMGYTVITTAEQFLTSIKANPSGKYILMNNIDMSTYSSDWSSLMQGVDFKGTLNGNGYTVSNFFSNRSDSDNGGALFDSVENATITDITFSNAHISSVEGGLFGETINGSTIANVSIVNSTISASKYDGGALSAQINHSELTNIRIDNVKVTALEGRVGGIAGDISNYSTVNNAYVNADVISYDGYNTGGIAGQTFDSTFYNIYSSGTVKSNTSNNVGQSAGGLFGSANDSYITNAYSDADVSSNATSTSPGASVGGLIGDIMTITIKNAYFDGTISGNFRYKGAVFGELHNTTADQISNVIFNSSKVTEEAVGYISNSTVNEDEISGLSDSAFHSESTFAALGSSNWYVTDQTKTPGLTFEATVTGGQSVAKMSYEDAINAGYTVITTAEQLAAIAPDGKYILMADIDVSDYEPALGSASYIGCIFSGTLDGNGFKIKNLNTSLFYQTQGATLTNLKLENVNIPSSASTAETGALVRVASNTNISYSSVSGVVGYGGVSGVNAPFAGMLVGTMSDGSISYSSSSGIVGGTCVGGLVGVLGYGAELKHSYSTATVIGPQTTTTSGCVGGLVGKATNQVSITNNFYAGKIDTAIDYAGLVGDATISTTIKNNFWSGADNAYASSDSSVVASNNQKFDFDNYASSAAYPILFKDAGFTEDIWDLSGAMPTLKDTITASSSSVATLTGSTNITVNHMNNGYISSSSDPTETLMITYTKDGVETTKNIQIQSGAALNDVMDTINQAQSDIKVSVQNGKLVFAGTTGSVSDIKIDSTGDFAGYYGLRETQTDWNWTEASGAMSTTTVQTSTGSTITGSVGGIEGTDGGFTEGSFTIVLGTDGTGGTGGSGSTNNGVITGDTNVFEPNYNNGVITGGNTVQGTSAPELSNTLTGSNTIEKTHLTEAEASAQGYILIRTAADLKKMSTSGKYMLVNDIDLSGTTWTPLFLNNEFTGTLDGNGYEIKNLKVDYSSSTNSSSYASLLGRTNGATIKDLGIQLNSINSSGGYIGALAGMAQNTNIINCYVTGGTVSSQGGTVVGGLVGCFSGTMTNSYSTASVWTSNLAAGGLVGNMTSGSISNSYATGPVVAQKGYVGGFIGSMNGGSITNSYSTGTVTANGSSDPTTTVNIGGFIGSIANGNISNSYTTSNVNYSTGSTYIGVFAGNANNPSTMLSNNKARNLAAGIGAIGNTNVQANSSQVEFLPLDQFGNSSSFSGWSSTIWDFSGSIPRLKTIITEPSFATSKFKINGTEININGTNLGFTIEQAVNNINARTSSTGVEASIKNGKLVLESVNGTDGITIENVSGNFLDVVGIEETNTNPVTQIALITASEININGVDISLSASSVATALSTINSKTSQTGVVASIEGGKFILKNQDGSTDNIYFFNNSGNFAEVTGLEQTGRITEAEAKELGYTVIKSAQDLQNINNNLNGKYILMDNIDLSGVSWTQLGQFTGEFNGNGYTIKNLTSNTESAGLFSELNSATVRNLIIDNAEITGVGKAGALAGDASQYSYIYNVSVINSDISAAGDNIAKVGGIVGNLQQSSTIYVANVANTSIGSINTSSSVGGIAGYVQTSSAVSNAAVTGTTINGAYSGGIAGYMHAMSSISSAYVSDTVTVTGSTGAGGIVASTTYNGNTISNAYVSASINCSNRAGGFAGYAIGLTVSDSYFDGSMSQSGAALIHTGHNAYGQVSIVNSGWASTASSGYAVTKDYVDAQEYNGATPTSSNTSSLSKENLYNKVKNLDWNETFWNFSGSKPEFKNNFGYGYKDVSAGMININGQSINIDAGDISNAIDAINAVSSTTGVVASINENGNVVLKNADGSDKQIVINSCTSDFLDVAGIEKAGADPMASVQRLSESEALAQGYTIIKTADDLKNISGDVSKKYMLMNDIDMSDVDWTTIAEFKGTLDGNGYTIKNLKDTLIQSAGTIKNIEFENINITDNGIFANVDNLSNVHATGSVHSVSGNVGGLATSAGRIENSSFEGTVEGRGSVGGLAATVNGDIVNSYTKGSVTSDGDTGGLVGELDSGTIENSYSEADVTGCTRVGGLVGEGTGDLKITNSYTTGDITATSMNGVATNVAGGIVGQMYGAVIENCYATGNVTSTSYAGGLAGVAYGSIKNSYASGDVIGYDYGGGLVGMSSDTDRLELQNVFFAGSVEAYYKSHINQYGNAGSLIGHALNADTSDEVIITNSYVLNNNGSSLPIVDGDNAEFVDTSDVTEVTNMSQIKSNFSQVWDTDIWDFSGEMPQLKFAMQEAPAPSGSVTIDITADDTVDTILAKLQDKGIDAQLVDGHIVINGVTQDVTFEGTSSFAQDVGLIGSSVNPDYEMQIGSSTSGGGYTFTGAEVAGLKGGTQLFGLTDGTVVIKDSDGNSYTVNVSSTDTVNDVLDKMTEALGGIITDAYVKDGRVIIESTKELSFDENASTSNFLKLTGLSETATIFNGYGISIGASDGFVRVTGSVSGLENGDILGGVKDGNLVLSQGSRTQTISVSSTDTVLALINKINATADFEAGLDASGHFYIQSKHESTEAIKIDTSNAVNIDEILGLTAGTFTGSLTESLGAQGHIQVTGTVGLTPDTNNGVQTGTNTIISTPHLSEAEAKAQGYTIIKTVDDLKKIKNNDSGSYILMNDIDLSGVNWTPLFVSTGLKPASFKGILDGNGYEIKNLKVNVSHSYASFLGQTYGATIRNLGIDVDSVYGGASYTGALIGKAIDTTISNCYVTGGTVSGTTYIGGLVGEMTNGTVTNSYSTVNVSGKGTIAGLIAYATGNISNSYATGNVTASSSGAAGFIDYLGQNSNVANSYSTGNVTGGNDTAGFISMIYGNVSNSYTTGKVTSSSTRNVGGFAGFVNPGSKLSNIRWDKTKGQSAAIGSTGSSGTQIDTSTVIGLTTAQFASSSNFSGWSSSIWDFSGSTPKLKTIQKSTQVTAGTISINGTNVSISAGSIDDAIAQINAKTNTTGVVASIENNKVVFRYKDGRTDGLNIKAGSSNFVSVTGTAFTAGTVNDKVIPAANSGSGKTFTISTASTGDTFSVNITSGMTIKQLFEKINASGLYSAAFNSENKVVITALKDGMTDITFGGTSNLQSYLGLSGGGTSNVQGDLQLGTSDSYSTLTGGAIVNTDMTFSEGDFSITAGGKTVTFHVAEGETITSVLNKITSSDVGVSASIQNGKVVLTATTGGNVNLSIQDGTSNFVELAGFVTSGGDQIVSVVKGELATYTSQNTAATAENLGISAGDFYIHLTDADGNITDTAKIDISENEDIASIIGKINNSGLGITATVNDSGKLVLQRNSSEEAGGILVSKGSSDFTNKIGFTSGGYQAPATEYGSQSVLTSVNPISTSQKFSEGDFIISIDDNGTTRETTIDVSASDSIYDIIDKINAADAGVTASLNASNKLVITKDADTGEGSITLKKGSSDFTTIFGFTSGGIYNGTTLNGEAATHTVLVSDKLSVSGKATMASLGVTEGSFKINGVEISISSTDTIEDVIGRINTVFNDAAYKDIAVYAEFKNNQIVITTKDASSNARITIESGSTNFTEVVGFTDIGSRDNVVDMGQNAEFNIKIGDDEVGKDFSLALDLNDITNDNIYNGNNLIYLDASGNVVSSANNAAITIELKQTGETVITLGKNLLDASIIELNKFIGNFNKAMIASENEILSDDTEFAKLITNIKEALTNDVADMRKIQQQLADIGITVDIRGGMNSNMGTVRLYLDKEKYTDAFYADSQHVLDLLVGKETAIGVEDGVLTRLNNVLFPEVNNKNGYFNKVPRQLEAIQKQLKREITQTTFDLNELRLAVSGDNGTAGLSEYLEKLEEQYNFVNEAIANLNKQYATSVTRLILNQNNSGFNPIV